jgi:hypothetical protein
VSTEPAATTTAVPPADGLSSDALAALQRDGSTGVVLPADAVHETAPSAEAGPDGGDGNADGTDSTDSTDSGSDRENPGSPGSSPDEDGGQEDTAARPGTARLATPTGTVPVVVTSTGPVADTTVLARAGRGTGDAVVRNVLAATLVQRAESGSSGSTAGAGGPDAEPALVLDPGRPTGTEPTGGGLGLDLAGVSQLVGELTAARVVAPTAVPALLDRAADAERTVALRTGTAAEDLLAPEATARLGREVAAVDGVAATLLPPDSPGAPDPAELVDPLRRAALAAGSATLAADPAVGVSLLDTLAATTTALHAGVSLAPSRRSYTLASSASPLVLTVQNTLPYRAQVLISVTGGQFAGLKVTDPGPQTVEAGRSLQVRVPAEVSRSGSFQVTVALRSPTGDAWGPSTQLSVRSSAYGAFTLVVVVVAGTVLLLMVVWRIRQRWRAHQERRRSPDGSDGAAPDSAADPDRPGDPGEPDPPGRNLAGSTASDRGRPVRTAPTDDHLPADPEPR